MVADGPGAGAGAKPAPRNARTPGKCHSGPGGDGRIQQSFRENAELSDALEHIQISVTNGEVVLRGEVKNAEDKEAIERQVRRIEGVRGITNHLQVAGQ